MPERHADSGSAYAGPPLRSAVRRGAAPVALGLLSLLASWPATRDLDPLLKWVGVILVALGLVIMVATARTLRAFRQEDRLTR